VTQPDPPGNLVDPGNPFLGVSPALLGVGRLVVPQPDGGSQEMAVVTLRCGNATLTALVTRDELSSWISNLTGTRDKMTTLAVGGPGPHMPWPGANGGGPG